MGKTASARRTAAALALALGLGWPMRAAADEGGSDDSGGSDAVAVQGGADSPAPADGGQTAPADAPPAPPAPAPDSASSPSPEPSPAMSAPPAPPAPAPDSAAPAPAAAAAPEAPAAPRVPRAKPRKAARGAKPSPLLVQGRAALRQGRLSRAIALLERATRRQSSSAEAFFQLGEAYDRRAFAAGSASAADKDDAQAAADAYETALGLDPRLRTVSAPFRLFEGLARCREALGDYERALVALKSASKAAPRDPLPGLYSARVRLRMRDAAQASADLLWSVRRARRVDAYPQLARLVRADPSFAGLMALPQDKVILDSYDAVQRGALTDAQAAERVRSTGEAGELRDSVRDVPSAAASRPAVLDGPRVDPGVLERVERGHAAYEAGAFEDAVRQYLGALKADARKGTMDAVTQSLVFERLGSAYRQLGRAGEATSVLARAVAALPTNSSAHFELALSFAVEGRPGDSLGELGRALDTAATLPQLRKTLLLAKTDPELASVRDLPGFAAVVAPHERRLSARR